MGVPGHPRHESDQAHLLQPAGPGRASPPHPRLRRGEVHGPPDPLPRGRPQALGRDEAQHAVRQLPLLQFGGEVIAQSMAIVRFLAAEFGLKGKSNLESAQIDEVVDTIEDAINVTIKTHFESDPKAKAALVAKVNKETVLPMLANIEKRLAGRGGQFLVGNALSLADLHL